MKRVIIISVIFALFLSLAAFELVFSTKLYTDLKNNLIELSIEMEKKENKEDKNSEKALSIMDQTIERWNEGKKVVFLFGNTTLLRSVDDRLLTLNAVVKSHHPDDFPVALASAKGIISAVLNDTHPNLTNLL